MTRRYSFKGFPEPALVPLSFRVPESVALLLQDRIERSPDIENKTAALQDALVKWLMIEDHLERTAAGSPAVPHVEPTTLEDVVRGD